MDILGLWFLSWTFQLSIRANGLNSGHNPITPKSIKMHQPSEGARRSDAYCPEHLVKDKTLRFFLVIIRFTNIVQQGIGVT